MLACMGNLHGLRSFESDYIIGFMKALLLLGSSQQELKMSARTKNVSDKITSKLSGIPKVSISQVQLCSEL